MKSEGILEKLTEALLASAAGNVAILVLIFVVGLMFWLMREQIAANKATAAALERLAGVIGELRIELARGKR